MHDDDAADPWLNMRRAEDQGTKAQRSERELLYFGVCGLPKDDVGWFELPNDSKGRSFIFRRSLGEINSE